MTEILMALLAIGIGAFMIFIGICIGMETPALYGAECVFMGFMSFLCVVSGLMCFTMLAEM